MNPFTCATGIVGGLFFSGLYSLTGKPAYKDICTRATRWLLNNTIREDGHIAEVWRREGFPPRKTPSYSMISYVGEGLIWAHTHIDDEALKREIERKMSTVVKFLLQTQNANGTWAVPGPDQERSPLATLILNWYYRNVKKDNNVAQAIRRNYQFLLDPDNSVKFGVRRLVRVTGFVGLVLADLISAGVTFHAGD